MRGFVKSAVLPSLLLPSRAFNGTTSSARELRNAAEEHARTTRVHVGIIYMGFLIFVAVAALLYGQLVPELLRASQAVATGGSSRFSATSGVTLGDYRTSYFLSSLAQGIGGGIVAGFMTRGTLKAGLVHAFAMVAVTLGVFQLMG